MSSTVLRSPQSRVGPAAAAGAAVAGVLIGSSALAFPVPVIGLLAAALGVTVVVRWPEAALAAIFVLVPFHFVGYQVLVGRAHVNPGVLTYWKDALIVGVLLRGAWTRFRESGDQLPRSNADRFLLGYVLFLTLVAAASPHLQAAGTSLAQEAEGPLILLAVVAVRPRLRVVWMCVTGLLAVGVVMSIGALIEQHFQFALQRWYGFTAENEVFYSDFVRHSGYRSGSFFGDSLVLGFFLAAVTTLACGAVLTTRRRMQWLAAAATVICAAGTVVTYTRSAYYGAGVGILLTLVLGLGNPRLRYAIAGLFVVGTAMIATVAVTSGDERIVHSQDNQAHFDLIRGDFELLLSHPLGFGLGTTDYVAHRFDIQTETGQTSVDSVYGDRAVEGGITGLVLYLIALFWTLLRLRAARLAVLIRNDVAGVALVTAAIGVLAGNAVAGILLPNQQLPIGVAVWGVAGLALVAAGQRPRPSPPLSPAAGVSG